jgi:hypothetical protein
MAEPTCPRCGSIRVYREEQRVPLCIGAMAVIPAGWYSCRDCWYKWDGIIDGGRGMLPAGVVARGGVTK